MKKTWIAGLMAVVLLLSGGWVLAEDANENYKPIYFNGVLMENAQAFVLPFSSAYDYHWGQYLPYAAIAQKLGYVTTYDSTNEVVTSVKGNNYFQFDLKNHTTYLLKDSEPFYWYWDYIERNGTLLVSYYGVQLLLDVTVDWTENAVHIYDTDALVQSVRPRFSAFYAWLEQIPTYESYTCEGSGTMQFTADTKRFGIQVNGGMDSNLLIQKNGEEILSTMSTIPNGFLNLNALDSIYGMDGKAHYYLTTPITAGAYQNQDGTFALISKAENYQFASLVPSLQDNWYMYEMDTFDDSYKRGWLQVPDNVQDTFSEQLWLLQAADKNDWDIDYLLRSYINKVISQYGDQGMEVVDKYITFAAKLLSPPYLNAAQSDNGSVTLSYHITREQYQQLLTEQQITATDDPFDSFFCYLQPDIQLTMQFSGSAFTIATTATVDMSGFPAEYLLDDISAHCTLDTKISGTVGPVDIRQPELKTTAMLEEAVQKFVEQNVVE